MQNAKNVCVIGAGIAGAAVAQDLSQTGMKVHLVERQSTIGGRVAEMGCKATDVCLRCNVCVANELLRSVAGSPDIHIYTRTQLTKLEAGTNGSRYTVTLKHEPSFIDRSKCTSCQVCIGVCPEKCIVKPKFAIPPVVPVVDYSLCRNASGKKCSICEKACPVDAISMLDEESQSRLDVDAVVIATGYEPYNPRENASYGYGTSENIVTGFEVEQQLAVESRITRPSDGKMPKRIAFIQCVGSRTEEVHTRPEDTDYCSCVCCSYALRMAQLIKHESEDAEVTVFYMDIQNFGKGFNEFYNKCKDNMNFIRCRPYEVKQGQNDNIRIRYTPPSPPEEADSQICEQEFDMVVLAVGIRPMPDAAKLAETLMVPVDEQGFFGFKGASCLPSLQREGIFAAGACESPKDIESCIRQAAAVSAAVQQSLLVEHDTR